MNKIEIKMTVAETFERNLKKEKRLKELWNVSGHLQKRVDSIAQ